MKDEEKTMLKKMYEEKKRFFYSMANQCPKSPMIHDTFIELNTMANILTKLGVSI